MNHASCVESHRLLRSADRAIRSVCIKVVLRLEVAPLLCVLLQLTVSLTLTILQSELFVRATRVWRSFAQSMPRFGRDLSNLSAEERSISPGRSEDGGLL